MSDFLVLGLIPGTHIQITFLFWLIGASVMLAVCAVRFAQRAHLFRDWIIATMFIVVIRQRPGSFTR